MSAALVAGNATVITGGSELDEVTLTAKNFWAGERVPNRALMMYQRDGLTGESSRDAEFALENTPFRFGWRYDVALVEESQINEHPGS